MTAPATNPFDGRFTTHRVIVNGLQLSYTDWNRKASSVFLLVHGLHVQGHVWDPLAAELAREHRVICPDLRGHGDSHWAREDGYWTPNFVADLHALVQALGVGPVVYVGHSLGARIGYVYGAWHPGDLRGMVLADTAPSMPQDAARIVSGIVGGGKMPAGFRTREEARGYYAATYPEWKPVFHDLHALHQLRENWAGRFVNKHDPDIYWITRSAGLSEQPMLWESAAKADVPALVMWGERSPYLDRALLDRIVGTMPRAQAAVLPSGHAIPREVPDEFLRETLRFAGSL